ncbi:MAG: hypothetical protein C0603_07430 [Denitrovibrio sp.]|nr:MAG: hypothetical protein C0603_07430 [Denitrovibrio sp.]
MLYLIPIILFTIFSCSGVDNSRLSPNSDFYKYQVNSNTVLERFAFQPEVMRSIVTTPISLKPTDEDFLTITTDLNNDGNDDIIGTIDHYKFRKDNTLHLYILISKDNYFISLNDSPRIRSLNLKVLTTSTRGYKDLSVDGKIYKFDGTNYK